MTEDRQREIFRNGKGIRPEDRNFIQGGPRQEESSLVFEKLPNEDESADVFKHGKPLDPSAKVFFGQRGQ